MNAQNRLQNHQYLYRHALEDQFPLFFQKDHSGLLKTLIVLKFEPWVFILITRRIKIDVKN